MLLFCLLWYVCFDRPYLMPMIPLMVPEFPLLSFKFMRGDVLNGSACIPMNQIDIVELTMCSLLFYFFLAKSMCSLLWRNSGLLTSKERIRGQINAWTNKSYLVNWGEKFFKSLLALQVNSFKKHIVVWKNALKVTVWSQNPHNLLSLPLTVPKIND